MGTKVSGLTVAGGRDAWNRINVVASAATGLHHHELERIPACKSPLRVLIADDDHDTADSCAMLVRFRGHAVRVAYDGAAVLQLATAFQPDVLLLDLAMPGMDGCQIARLVRQQRGAKQPLLIAITGFADRAHRLLGDAAGFDHVLAKPSDPAAVEKLLQHEKARLAALPENATMPPRACVVVIDPDDEPRCDRVAGAPARDRPGACCAGIQSRVGTTSARMNRSCKWA